MAFQVERTELPEILLITPSVHLDARGFFLESYKKSAFSTIDIRAPFIQDNLSRSRRGVLRGLHYQLEPHAQGKLIRVLRGEMFDVVVDIRSGSPTYAKWMSMTLSAEEHKMLYIPPGFAHGFYTLSREVEILYKVTREYNKAHERVIRWDDPSLGIVWPHSKPKLSDKDRDAPSLADVENNFKYPMSPS